MSSYVKRVGDLTEPVELSASQVVEKMTSRRRMNASRTCLRRWKAARHERR